MEHTLHNRPRGMTRRQFLEIAAATSLLAGCSPKPQPTSAPTDAPSPTADPTATVSPTTPPTPTSVPATTIHRPDVIKVYPEVPSKVVQTRHSSAWNDDELSPEILRQMLDASIQELTGLDDAGAAWAALFRPDERVAIKVNTINSGFTHVPLVLAVVGCLQDAGVPAEQIVIFDRYTPELESAGYPINRDGPGVRCHGTDLHYTPGWQVDGTDVTLSDILLDCHALINIPVLKRGLGGRDGIGITFALKNHYGSFDQPTSFHYERLAQGIAGLNALPPIKERTRLIIGDMLKTRSQPDGVGFRFVGVDSAILMSFDPVAHDTIGLQRAVEELTAEGKDPAPISTAASTWLALSAESGVGTDDPSHIDLVEINLG